VRQVIYRHKDFPKNFHPLGDREFLVRAAAKNLEKSLRKHVCPFANHGTLPLHGELSGQVGGQNLAKNQKSVQSEASALKEPTARRCMVGSRGVEMEELPEEAGRKVQSCKDFTAHSVQVCVSGVSVVVSVIRYSFCTRCSANKGEIGRSSMVLHRLSNFILSVETTDECQGM
jgi:hypothetical protein